MPDINAWNVVQLLYAKYSKPPYNKASATSDEEKELADQIDGNYMKKIWLIVYF